MSILETLIDDNLMFIKKINLRTSGLVVLQLTGKLCMGPRPILNNLL